ncbi:Glycosyltransferase involved in cell wall bisynthesis [Shimia gijangensis]|uniref:Glycosyltransferase involved in cell wall bisynthesis n=2 Tax=Shimia gijangensis TaxID=1470563 RepID=A0A1M6QI55_9RHOB|nr:Glycosyltransferase involved in cell wall bisynthesis [Shimia gijangensis]
MQLHSIPPTGIDRVCFAYLKALCDAPEPVYGLVRTASGYVLLDDVGMQEVLARMEGRKPWGPPDFLSKLLHKPDWYKHYTEAELRRLRIARCQPAFLGRILRRHLPEGTVYLNVGQSNVTERLIRAVKSVPKSRFVPFLHDTIPMDFPDYQTPDSIKRFEQMFAMLQGSADAILCNSQVSADDVKRHMAPLGVVPPIHVAHLGVDNYFFQYGDNKGIPTLPKPYFVLLGTIEPRKNHALILDVWEALEKELPEQEMPHLVVCGRRGWMNDEVFDRLDNSPQRSRYLHEFNELNDNQIQALQKGSAGSLFPSFCEGFGLPPGEAASMGVPVICNPLPVFREFLKDIPIYASVADSYAWKQAIKELAQQARARGKTQWQTPTGSGLPTWESHFNVVLKMT